MARREPRAYKTVTQYSMGPIEEIGLLKMDFLGLRNLDVIEDAVDIIERSRGERVDIKDMPLDDRKTYAMLSRGDSVGVFQFESDGMRDALKAIKPTEFQDLVAIGALYRPGAMRFIPDYAQGQAQPGVGPLSRPGLRPITETTYGCVIYQEQLMEIAKQMAGFSPAEADDLRKAVGKKKRDLMATMKEKFLEGMAGLEDRPARRQGPLVPDGGRGRLLLQPLPRRLLRADLLPDGLAARQLSGRVHGGADLDRDVDEGQGPVLRQPLRGDGDRGAPPDVNSSDHGFVVSGNCIRFGLDAVKNVGHIAVQAILDARERREFTSTLGLLRAGRHPRREQARRRVPGQVRSTRLDRRRRARGCSRRCRRPRPSARRPRRTHVSGSPRSSTSAAGRRRPAPSRQQHARSWPRSSTSASCSASRRRPSAPSSPHTRSPRSRTRSGPRVDCSLSSLADKPDGAWVTVGGIITEFKRHTSKNGSLMSFATLDDIEGQLELLVMGKAYEASREFLAADAIVVVRGRLDHKGRGETKLVAQEVELFQPTEDEVAKARAARDTGPLRLGIDATAFGASLIEELKGILENFPGDSEVILVMRRARGFASFQLRPRVPGAPLRRPRRGDRCPPRHRIPGRCMTRQSTRG